MKQHVTGFLLFSLIIGLTASIFYIGHSIADSLDVNAVLPVLVEPPNLTFSESDKTIPYRVDLVQYDIATQTLLARLMISNHKQVPSDYFTVTAVINEGGDPAGPSSSRTIIARTAKARRYLDNSIEVEFEARVPALDADRNQNFYASFVIYGPNDDQSPLVERNSIPATPVLFIHEKPFVYGKRRLKSEPDILQ